MKFKRVKFNEFQENYIEYCRTIVETREGLEKIFSLMSARLMRELSSMS